MAAREWVSPNTEIHALLQKLLDDRTKILNDQTRHFGDVHKDLSQTRRAVGAIEEKLADMISRMASAEACLDMLEEAERQRFSPGFGLQGGTAKHQTVTIWRSEKARSLPHLGSLELIVFEFSYPDMDLSERVESTLLPHLPLFFLTVLMSFILFCFGVFCFMDPDFFRITVVAIPFLLHYYSRYMTALNFVLCFFLISHTRRLLYSSFCIRRTQTLPWVRNHICYVMIRVDLPITFITPSHSHLPQQKVKE